MSDSILAFLRSDSGMYDFILAFLGVDHSLKIHFSARLGCRYSLKIHFSAFLGGIRPLEEGLEALARFGSRSRPMAAWSAPSGRLEGWGAVKHVLPAPGQI